MSELFDDPGDLGFFDQEDDVEDFELERDEFYEPFPGEDI